MFKILISTIGSKFLVSLLNFLTIILTARELAAEGRGEISLFFLNIVIIMMFSDFVGGGALVYLIPRFETLKILIPSYVWSFFCCIILSFSLQFLGFAGNYSSVHLPVISIMMCLNSVNMMVILGKNNVKRFNELSILQNGLITISLLILFYFFKKKEISSYFLGLYISSMVTLLLSGISIFKYLQYSQIKGLTSVIAQTFKFGSYVQIGNIVQLLNYRLSYYILEKFSGIAAVGVFSTGTSIAEGMWIPSKALAQVQYSSISNSSDRLYSIKLTLLFLKISFASVITMLIPLLLIPSAFYQFIFGNDFGDITIIIYFLCVGIISFALSNMLSHYFSGVGKHYINTLGALIGLVITIAGGFLLIPAFGLKGAAMTATLSYTSITIYQWIIFKKETNIKFTDLIPEKNDFQLLMHHLKTFIKKKP